MFHPSMSYYISLSRLASLLCHKCFKIKLIAYSSYRHTRNVSRHCISFFVRSHFSFMYVTLLLCVSLFLSLSLSFSLSLCVSLPPSPTLSLSLSLSLFLSFSLSHSLSLSLSATFISILFISCCFLSPCVPNLSSSLLLFLSSSDNFCSSGDDIEAICCGLEL